MLPKLKNTGPGIQSGVDESKLRIEERLKIACARRHFATVGGLNYRVVQRLDELE